MKKSRFSDTERWYKNSLIRHNKPTKQAKVNTKKRFFSAYLMDRAEETIKTRGIVSIFDKYISPFNHNVFFTNVVHGDIVIPLRYPSFFFLPSFKLSSYFASEDIVIFTYKDFQTKISLK